MAQATPAFMIDGPRTVDRDDAIRLESAEDGSRVLTVYVADLTAALDADPGLLGTALERGATRYRQQGAVETMLPAQVEGACTLAERAERPAVVVRILLDEHGGIVEATLSRCVLGDAVALTHEEAAGAVRNRRARHHRALSELRAVAEDLFRARYGASSAFYDFAHGVFVDEDGALMKVKASHVVGHLIVQECMIAANRTIAEWAVRNDVPIMFRNHLAAVCAPPAAVHLEDLSAALHSDDPNGLATWLARAEMTGRRARYDAHPRGHHGLGLAVYCHATSPLRRAADLITQRSIVAHLDAGPAPFGPDQIAEFCDRLTVVIAETNAVAGAAARERAHTLARQILDADVDYRAMRPERFFALGKRAAKEGITSPGFLAEVTRRAEADLLELRDLYHLLLLPTGEQWTEAKRSCVAQLARHPEHAVSLVAMCATTRGLDAPAYRHEMSGPPHRPVFTSRGRLALSDETSAEGAVRSAATKQAAQAQAALSLLAVLAGVPDASTDLAAPAEADRMTPHEPQELAGDPFQVLNHAINTRLLTDVTWDFEETRAGGRSQFRAHVSACDGAGAVLEGRGVGETKKLAKSRAASELVDALKADQPAEAVPA